MFINFKILFLATEKLKRSNTGWNRKQNAQHGEMHKNRSRLMFWRNAVLDCLPVNLHITMTLILN